MSAVPPGNKQVGENSTIVAYGNIENYTYLKNYTLNGVALTQDGSSITPKAISNAMVGENSIIVTYSTPLDAGGFRTYVTNGYVVVQELPTAVYKNFLIDVFAVVSTPTEEKPSTTILKNIMVGDSTLIPTIGQQPNTTYLKSNVVIGYLVVKEVKKRKETTTFNVSLHTEKLDFNTF